MLHDATSLTGGFQYLIPASLPGLRVSDLIVKRSRVTLCSTLHHLTKEQIHKILFQVTEASC